MDKKVKGMVNDAAKLAGRIIARGARETGKFLYDHRREAFGAAIGVTKGTYGILSDIYGHTKTDTDFNEKINTYNNKVSSVTANGKDIPCDKVILATGHSARDVFAFLKDEYILEIPFDEKKASHNPKAFTGKRHYIYIRKAFKDEIYIISRIIFV